ncbi:MAG: class I adenylate-forming enzyme family protein [Mycobacteriales bacterium]
MRIALAADSALLPWARASADPSGACLADARTSLDNAAFAAHVERAAQHLETAGVRAGDTLAVRLRSDVDLVATVFAGWSLGAAVLPVSPDATRQQLLHQLADSGAVTIVSSPELSDIALPPAQLERTGSSLEPASPEDFALLLYGSELAQAGSGVLLDHRALLSVSEGIGERLSLGATDRVVSGLDTWSGAGLLIGVLPALSSGAELILSPGSTWEAVRRLRPSVVIVLADQLHDTSEDWPDPQEGWRTTVAYGRALPAAVVDRFHARSGSRLLQGYGHPESAVLSTLQDPSSPPSTLGRSLAGQRVAVMSASTHLQPHGVLGEVVLQGPALMRGYLGRPDDTARLLRGGWLHTGDVGLIDAAGHLVLVGSLDTVILRDGDRIYPREIEDVLHRHPDVADARVVGQPDPVLGEVPVALVVLAKEATASVADILAYCRNHLPRPKVPDAVRVLKQLP